MTQFEKEMRRLNALSLENVMSPLTYRVMAAFIQIADKDNFPAEVKVTLRMIGSIANVVIPTVYKAIDELRNLGLIKSVVTGWGKNANVYVINYVIS